MYTSCVKILRVASCVFCITDTGTPGHVNVHTRTFARVFQLPVSSWNLSKQNILSSLFACRECVESQHRIDYLHSTPIYIYMYRYMNRYLIYPVHVHTRISYDIWIWIIISYIYKCNFDVLQISGLYYSCTHAHTRVCENDTTMQLTSSNNKDIRTKQTAQQQKGKSNAYI